MKPLRVKRDAPIVPQVVCCGIQPQLKPRLAALMASSWVRTACWREALLLWSVNAAAYGLGWSEETVRFFGWQTAWLVGVDRLRCSSAEA